MCNLGKGGKKVGEEAETKKKKKKKNGGETRKVEEAGEKERLPEEQDSGNVDEKDGKREEPSGNGEEG